MEVHCIFENSVSEIDNSTYFVCGVKDQKITENLDLKFIGKHEVGRSKYDVTSIYFHNCEVTRVPQGLTKIFPNLKSIDIRISNLKDLTRNDLVEYKNLKEFRCFLNQIEFLPGDLFEDFKHLETISFYGNHLQIIEPNILDGLKELKFVDFRENLNYNKWYSIVPGLRGNVSLDELKNEIRDKFFASNSQNIKDFCSKMQQKIQNFRECKERLYEKNHRLKSKLEIEKHEKVEVVQNLNNKISDLSKQLESGLNFDLRNFIQTDESFKDFHVKINDLEFSVHKFLLVARSPTLAEMLKSNPKAENLNLVDISVEIFEKILKFLYTDELPREGNFLHLFAAAGQLKIENLKKYAAEKILEQSNDENLLEILNLGKKYEYEELSKRAYEEIKRKYSKIEFKDEWIEDIEKLMKIVKAYIEKERAEKEFTEALC